MYSDLSRLEPLFLWLVLITGIFLVFTRNFLTVELSIRWRNLEPVQAEINYDPVTHNKAGMTLLNSLEWEAKIASFSTPPPKPKPKAVGPRIPARPQIATPANLDELFGQAARDYDVEKDLLTKIAACESGFHPTSVNPGGPYLGMFQYLESTWMSTRKEMGLDPNPSLVFDPAEAIKTSAWKIAHGGIDSWPVCSK